MTLQTRQTVMPLVTLTPVKDTRHKAEYTVTRNSDGVVVGTVYRRHWTPNVNYPGTRIRRPLKGYDQWFACLPFAMQIRGPRHHRLPCRTRWEAIEMLLRHYDLVGSVRQPGGA
jgi:hypothetical protein